MLARLLSGIALLGSFAVSLSGQTVPVPWINVQFTDQSGRPLSGGKVYTCVAGTSCPGTTRLTYTNSSGSTANSNPVTLDANGRAAIWLTANVAYKFVVTNIIGTVIAGAGGDNITGGSGGGGGGGSSPWTTSGANIYNSNAGNVGIGTSSPGYQLEVGGNTQIDGVLRIRNSDLTPHAVNITSQSGMAGDYFLSLPLALPGATSCLQVNTAGFMSYLAGCASGGGGGGAGNGSFPFSASTGFTITHNLNSTDILVDCYDDGTPELLIALTATYPKLTANTAVVAWTGSKSGHCVVNSSAGNPNIWSRDGDDNITLTDSLTAVSALKFLNQTASTGATNVVIQAGAGQAVGGILSFKDNGGATQAYVDGTSFGFLSSQFADIGGVFEVSSFGGLRLSSAKGTMWSSDGTFFGTPDLGLNRNAAGILEINSGTPGTFRDLHLRNLIIDGTCTGSACGGGGSSAPFSDAGPLVKNNFDNTKQERISLVNVPTSTTGVLTVKAAASYVLPGENIANTWGTDQTFAGYILASAGGKNIGSTSIPFQDEFFKQAYIETLRIAQTGSSFTGTFRFQSTVANTMDILNTAGNIITSWDCSAIPCQTSLLRTNVNIRGTSSGTTLPLQIQDTGSSPGINLYDNTNVKEATWSAGATVAMDIRDNADTHRFVVLQNGHTQVGVTADQGFPLYVSGNIFASGNITCGGSCGSGAGIWNRIGTTVSLANSGDLVQLSGNLQVGFGANNGNLNIDRSISSNTAQIAFTVAGSTGVTGAWTTGINLGVFNLLYGPSVLEYYRTDQTGLTRFTGSTSGTTYTLGVRDTSGSPGINFWRSTTTKAGSISSGATVAFGVQDQFDTHRLDVFQSGNVQVGSTTDQGFKFYVNGTGSINGQLNATGFATLGGTGQSGVVTVRRGDNSGSCTITFSGGIAIATTC